MRIVAGGLIGLGLGLAFFFGVPVESLDRTPPIETEVGAFGTAPVEGAVAPDFELMNLDGEPVLLSDLKGKVVLLNFWATWCAPCRVEMPAIQRQFEEHADTDFLVLGINFDESEDLVEQFGTEFGLTFPLLLDPGGRVQQLYRVRGYPSTYIIDRDGTIKVVHIGVMTEGQLEDYLETMGN